MIMSKIEEIVSENQCTGCYACADSCPVNVIIMAADQNGFQVPRIVDGTCIACHVCEKVCPVISYENDHFQKPNIFAVRAVDEIRMHASSGGVFPVIAEYILKEDGCCMGAGWETPTTVKHMEVFRKEDLRQIQGSRYMQSNLAGCMRLVKNNLETGRKVLFAGTPCQVAGLYKFLGKNYPNLLTIDLICHGVPSDKAMKKYFYEIIEQRGGSRNNRITKIDFRKKGLGWGSGNIVIEWEDGTYVGNIENDCFEKAYHNNLCLRESCYDCKFSEFPRTGDLSISSGLIPRSLLRNKL